jgi:hypothetical protein
MATSIQKTTNAIIRHLTSGEYYLATLAGDKGNAVGLSSQIHLSDVLRDGQAVTDLTDGQWDPSDGWKADKFVVVHSF